MKEPIRVEEIEADCPPNGFETQLGKIAPFYGRDVRYVIVGAQRLTPQEARHAGLALLRVAHVLESTATVTKRQTEE
jgi:hypothetical protein